MRSSLSMLALILAGLAWPLGRKAAPSQPIAFSHRVHAGENQMGCTMCHPYAAHSSIAGVPSASRCAGCHKFIDREKPEIQRVNQAFAEGKPIVWNRIYRLPDHVYFTHQRHIAAGLACQRCHGEVEKMDEVRVEAPLTMGWCLDCHHALSAAADCVTCHK